MANLVMTSKELNKRSTEIAKSARTIGADVHKHNVLLVKHILRLNADGIANGDVTVAERFVNALTMTDKESGKGISIIRVDAVKRWLSDFGFVNFTKEGAKLSSKSEAFKAAKADGFKAHIKRAELTAWNKYTVEPGELNAAFLIDKEALASIKSLIEKREKAMLAKGKYDRQTEKARASNVIDSDTFQKLLEMKAELELRVA